MDIVILYFSTVSLLGFFSVLAVGIIAYLRRGKDSPNKFWFLLCMSASFWSLFYFLIINSPSKELSIFLRIFLDTFVILVILFWLRFVFAFLDIRRDKFFNYIALSAFGLFLLNIIPGFFAKDMVPKYVFNYYVEAGPGYYVYVVYFVFLIAYGFYLLFRGLYKTTGIKLAQIKYIILASLIGFFGASSAFLLSFNIYLPPYPFILMPIFPLLILYAISKYHLFDVKIIATELLTFALWLIFTFRTFFSGTLQESIFNGVILILTIFFGVLLIRSVIREVEQREKIEKMAKEIEKAYEVEKKANRELQELDKVKDQFLMITQHDLRRPLTLVKWFLDTLFLGLLGKQTKTTLEEAKKVQLSIESSIEEVNDFLDLAQFQMGKGGGLALKPGVELLPIMEGIVNKLKHQAESKGIYLKLENSDNLPKPLTVEADAIKLKAALSNIVDNAIKYTQEGGVEITISPNDRIPLPKEVLNPNEQNSKSVFIIVKDTGIGIPPEKIYNLFTNMFERTEQAQRATAIGKGIGLYLSSQIIKSHKGKIWAESAGEGKGSTFYIELPATK